MTVDNRLRLPTLEATRVRLRPPVAADAAALFEVFGDPVAMRWWDGPPVPSLGVMAQRVAAMAACDLQRFGAWTLALAATDRAIGALFYHHRDLQHRRVEIGYILARAHWGEGLMSEALPLLVHYCFTGLDAHRIEATVSPENAASIRILERAGFRAEGGILRQRIIYAPGDHRDALMYARLATDRG